MTAVVAAGFGVSAVIGLQNARHWYDVHELKDSIPDLNAPHDVEKVAPNSRQLSLATQAN